LFAIKYQVKTLVECTTLNKRIGGANVPRLILQWESLPLLLKVKDIQDILNISKNSAYELVNSKNFPAIKIGRCLRIPRDSFKEWVERQATNNE